MADPFEVRLRFTNLLAHLSASTTSSIRCAQYALKHRDMDEDLHSCILEQLERNNMNNRANIMYFLEHFCELSMKEGYAEYVDMIRRDIGRIVEKVVETGEDGSGAANVKVVRRVLAGLADKGVVEREEGENLESLLKKKEVGAAGGLLLMQDDDDDEIGSDRRDENGVREDDQRMNHNEEDDNAKVEIVEGANVIDVPKEDLNAKEQRIDVDAKITPRVSTGSGGRGGSSGGLAGTLGKQSNGVVRMDKRFIEQRIEEDRERNKRLRESMWAVGKEDEEELDKMWEEGSELGEDDYLMAIEEAEERRQAAAMSRPIAFAPT